MICLLKANDRQNMVSWKFDMTISVKQFNKVKAEYVMFCAIGFIDELNLNCS